MSRRLTQQVRVLRQRGAENDREATAYMDAMFPKRGKRSKGKMARLAARFPKAR